MLSRFGRVWLFVTLWTIDHQAPLSTGFSRQEYWSVLSCPPPGNLPNPGIKQINTAFQFQKKMYFLKNWVRTALFFYTHTRTHRMFFSIILNTQFCFDFQYALLVELGLVKKACFYHLCFIATNEYVPECFFFLLQNKPGINSEHLPRNISWSSSSLRRV